MSPQSLSLFTKHEVITEKSNYVTSNNFNRNASTHAYGISLRAYFVGLFLGSRNNINIGIKSFFFPFLCMYVLKKQESTAQ